MIDLAFSVEGVRPVYRAAVPTLAFRVRVQEHRGQSIYAILLRCQLQIEPRRRRHSTEEQERLIDIFSLPERWSETLHSLVWSQSTQNIPAFEGSIEVDVPVACSYDFEVTAAKYLASLENGEIPLRFLFSGTVFVKSENGFMVQQVPWDKEAVYRMPVSVWRELMDAYFPRSAWIRVDRETLQALQRFRAMHGLASWDEALEMMLSEAVGGGSR
jgi:hypothetical protein